MFANRTLAKWLGAGAVAAGAALGGGCASQKADIPPVAGMPKELNKVTMPEYVVEPPDVLSIDLLTAIPKPPYKIQPLDGLLIRATGTPPDAPVQNVYAVDPDGTVNLGVTYGSVPVAGKTIADAKKAVEETLKKILQNPQVDVSLAQGRAVQQVRGSHLVRPDGTINLGSYGSVRVVGQTLTQAKATIEAFLAKSFQAPEISLDVTGFNSKVYYVVFDGAGFGPTIQRMPITGNETVLDALGQIGGVTGITDAKRMWIARPTPEDANCGMQVLPVDFKAITECADTRTNYQLLPGDRLFVKAPPMETASVKLNRAIFPIERALGFTLLGVGAVRSFDQNAGGFNQGF